MTHEGCIGYVVGLAAWLVVRRWNVRGLFQASGGALAVCAAVAVPWILILLHFAPLSKIISSVAQAPGTRQGWLDGRLRVISATIIPLGWGQVTVLDAVFLFLSNCVLGVTLALILTRTLRRPRGPLAWSMIGGVIAGLVLIPTANATSGLYDTGFPAVVMLFVLCVAACPAGRWKALTAVGLTLAAATWAIIWIEASFPSPSDANLALKVHEHIQFIAGITSIPGLVVLSVRIVLGISRWRDWWNPGLLATPDGGRRSGLSANMG